MITDTTDADINTGIAIVRNGIISPSDTPVVHAASKAIWARGGPRSEAEARVCRFAENTTFIYPTDDRRPVPHELLEPIGPLAAVVEEKKAHERTTLDGIVAARAARERKPNERTRQAERDAEDAHRASSAATQVASTALMRAKMRIEHWRRATTLAASTGQK